MINFTLYMIPPIVLLMILLIPFNIIGIIWAMNREYAQHGAKDVHDTQCDTSCDTSCNTPDQNTGQKP